MVSGAAPSLDNKEAPLCSGFFCSVTTGGFAKENIGAAALGAGAVAGS